MINLEIKKDNENLLLVNKNGNYTIVIPSFLLNDITKISNEVIPFAELMFEWIYNQYDDDNEFTLSLKEDFYDLFLERLKQHSSVKIIKNKEENNV